MAARKKQAAQRNLGAQQGTRRLTVALVSIGLVLATLLAYQPALENDFVAYDDDVYLLKNPEAARGLDAKSVAWALTATRPYWHPVAWLSHLLDVELFGFDPAGHHLSSVAFHILCTLFLFLLLLQMTRDLWPSALAAALFGVHPVGVEVVAWVAERKEILSTLFGLLSAMTYVAYARRGGAARYGLSLGLFALALLSKPMLVTLPLLFLLLDDWPLGRMPAVKSLLGPEARKLVVEKIPFLVFSLAVSVQTLVVDYRLGTIQLADHVPLGLRLANAVVSYVVYIGMLLYPVRLGLIYTHPNFPGGTPWAVWQIGGAALLLVGITLLVLRSGRGYARTGWLWYLIALFPVIGVVQAGEQGMADRYAYVPFIGLYLSIAWGAAELVSKRRSLAQRGAIAAAVAVLATLLVATRAQARHWRSAESIFAHSLAVSPTSPTLHYDLAVVIGQGARTDEAIGLYRHALELRPGFAKAHNNLGFLLVTRGDVAEAERHYRAAIELDPAYADPLSNLGDLLGSQGRFDAAIEQYRAALRLAPDRVETHFNLGNALASLGRFDEAASEFAATLRLDPAHARAKTNLTIAVESAAAAGQVRPSDP